MSAAQLPAFLIVHASDRVLVRRSAIGAEYVVMVERHDIERVRHLVRDTDSPIHHFLIGSYGQVTEAATATADATGRIALAEQYHFHHNVVVFRCFREDLAPLCGYRCHEPVPLEGDVHAGHSHSALLQDMLAECSFILGHRSPPPAPQGGPHPDHWGACANFPEAGVHLLAPEWRMFGTVRNGSFEASDPVKLPFVYTASNSVHGPRNFRPMPSANSCPSRQGAKKTGYAFRVRARRFQTDIERRVSRR